MIGRYTDTDPTRLIFLAFRLVGITDTDSFAFRPDPIPKTNFVSLTDPTRYRNTYSILLIDPTRYRKKLFYFLTDPTRYRKAQFIPGRYKYRYFTFKALSPWNLEIIAFMPMGKQQCYPFEF